MALQDCGGTRFVIGREARLPMVKQLQLRDEKRRCDPLLPFPSAVDYCTVKFSCEEK
jgi:hypothetical protein